MFAACKKDRIEERESPRGKSLRWKHAMIVCILVFALSTVLISCSAEDMNTLPADQTSEEQAEVTTEEAVVEDELGAPAGEVVFVPIQEAEEAPVEAPEEEVPVEVPVEETEEKAPEEEVPEEEVPVVEAPVEETPAEETPAEETPVEEAPVEETPVEETPAVEAPVAEQVGTEYVLNMNSYLFHYPSCPSVAQMAEHNKAFFTGTRDEVILKGYTPCKNCNP